LVFEAHSTDYQTPENLRALVEDHWAILKVGPGLTFALREALFALARIEDELVEESRCSRLTHVIDERMTANPGWWQAYYEGDPRQVRLARRYSYSDRMRYYWPDPVIAAAVAQLVANLDAAGIPLPLLSQHLPDQYHRARRGELPIDARSIVVDRIRDALRPYSQACRPLVLAGASR
jgi:D-tagatose-1,6-bisphosphate aldolase subunit GatZ/KbaZ